MTLAVSYQRLPHAADLPAPDYATEGAAGLDLCAAVPDDHPLVLAPGAWAAIPTGLVLAIPPGHEGQVRPRSGLALAKGVTVLNAPGTVDSDYRGEVRVLLINLGHAPFAVTRGMRIAQLVFAPVARAALAEVAELSTTERGEGGFGSTGLSGRVATG
jgi:dUTP pyrophosphatase